jgi:hypothetical protein
MDPGLPAIAARCPETGMTLGMGWPPIADIAGTTVQVWNVADMRRRRGRPVRLAPPASLCRSGRAPNVSAMQLARLRRAWMRTRMG